MDQNFIIFKFNGMDILVSYICKGREISKLEIEDALSSYLDSNAYDEDSDYETIVDDIMSSFENDGLKYNIENFYTIAV